MQKITHNYENGMTTVNLRIVTDYVARIDWFYYTSLQEAVNTCGARENNNVQTTVHMLKDIALENGLEIHYGQNVRLNLDSYTLTSRNDSVITNYGKLEVVDLSEAQTGEISSSITGDNKNYYNVIHNKGDFSISSGTIMTDRNENYVLYNENGTANIDGGTVSMSYTNSYEAHVIHNVGTGTVNVNGGIVNLENDGSAGAMAIYNVNDGTINVKGGEVKATNIGISTAIRNNSTGMISLGIKGDGIVNASLLEIKVEGNNIAIKNQLGELHFYDGRIEGSKLAIEENSSITEIEEGTSILEEDGGKVITLTTNEDLDKIQVAKIGEVTYPSLQEAILAAGNNQSTIELLRGIQLTARSRNTKYSRKSKYNIRLKWKYPKNVLNN